MSTTWFVGADWLAEHIDDPEIQIIDARMASPGQEDRFVTYNSGSALMKWRYKSELRVKTLDRKSVV